MIAIVPHQPTWRGEFTSLALPLRESLGELAVRIDHIGSTAVPGLAAKDIIDIQVTVADLVALLESRLNSVGYHRLTHIVGDHVPPGASGDGDEWQKWFFKPGPEGRPVNLHVRRMGRANQRYALLFRDYLRAHFDVAMAYGQVKAALSRHDPADVEAYYDVKDPVCDIILSGAELWARATAWHPAPSDG